MDYEALTQQLESKLLELNARLDNVKRDVSQAYSNDSAEQAQERENDEVIDAIGDEARTSIKLVQQALQRLRDGSYGVCEQCGDDITQARLQAVPESACCIKCAEA